ncbi:heme-dependent oxidative N-demethylase family protein [Aurantiacibacter hainanensis]|uniref:heme-dependent oxidative N-demethylase family protein n=1 Tax=Aurantiacibacter hainanensis TaxID=3076114 RepID=UPI0030C6B55D
MSAKLGFSVEDLLPKARGGGALKMGLTALGEDEWLQPDPDLAARAAAFDAHPDAVQISARATAAGDELAAMLNTDGGLEGAARSAHEDMCLLAPEHGEEVYRLIGAAVAWPTDWHPANKMGLPLVAMHAPIHGYEEQLASGVDHFMAKLKPGRIFGRCNWFVAPTPARRWIDTAPPQETFAAVTAENAGETVFVRCERQTLRRLPQTGAVLFTIGVYLAPLGSLSDDNVARLVHSLDTIPPDEAERRGARWFAPQVAAYANRRLQTKE